MSLSKEKILSELRKRKDEFSEEELMDAIGATKNYGRYTLYAAYGFGGLFILVGLLVLLMQFWELLGIHIQLLITLILGIACLVLAATLDRYDNKIFASVSALLGAVLIPIGAYLFISEWVNISFSAGIQAVVALLLGVSFIGLFLQEKKSSYIFLSSAFFVWMFYAITNLGLFEAIDNRYSFITIALGIMFFGLASLVEQEKQLRNLSSCYYLVSPIMIMSQLAYLGHTFWFVEILAIVTISALIYLSVQTSNKSLFLASALSAGAYLFVLSGRYFADTIGWPIALILAGVVLLVGGTKLFNTFKKIK